MPVTKILILGKSGTGKSTAWRNMPADQSVIITPNDKPMPFPGASKKYIAGKGGNMIITSELTMIPTAIKHVSDNMPHVKYILVEDFTHYQSARLMQDAFVANSAFTKWNVFGKDVFNAVTATTGLRDDLFIFYNSHVDVKENGESSFRSSGKLLESTIDVPSYFTYILHTVISRKDSHTEYRFQTNADGQHQAKTPMGMFPDLLVDNDNMAIVGAIRKYQDG